MDYIPVLRLASGPLHDGRRRHWRRVLFCRCSGPPPVYLGCRKWRPPPGGTGRGAVNDGSAGDLWNYRLKKTGPEVLDNLCRVGKCGFTHACAHLRGQDIPLLWSLQVEVSISYCFHYIFANHLILFFNIFIFILVVVFQPWTG